jgi:hypothetical protein
MTKSPETSTPSAPMRSLANAAVVLVASGTAAIIATPVPLVGVPLAAVSLIVAVSLLSRRATAVPPALIAVILSATVLLSAAAMVLLTPHLHHTGGTIHIETA